MEKSDRGKMLGFSRGFYCFPLSHIYAYLQLHADIHISPSVKTHRAYYRSRVVRGKKVRLYDFRLGLGCYLFNKILREV